MEQRRVAEHGQPSPISLEGEVVRIAEQEGVLSLRLVLRSLTLLDLPPGFAADLHLGDRVAVDGTLGIEAVRSLPDLQSATRPASPGRAGGSQE